MGMCLEIPDVAVPDLAVVDTLVSRLKTAPSEHLPEDAASRVAQWHRPSVKELQVVLSIAGVSATARRVLQEILLITQQCEAT